MWISEYVTGGKKQQEKAAKGEVKTVTGSAVSLSGTRDYSSVPLIAPTGIAYVPVLGSQAVVISGESGCVCLGSPIEPQKDLQPGELMLYSAGGARLVLKNDGRVYINGKEVG